MLHINKQISKSVVRHPLLDIGLPQSSPNSPPHTLRSRDLDQVVAPACWKPTCVFQSVDANREVFNSIDHRFCYAPFATWVVRFFELCPFYLRYLVTIYSRVLQSSGLETTKYHHFNWVSGMLPRFWGPASDWSGLCVSGMVSTLPNRHFWEPFNYLFSKWI